MNFILGFGISSLGFIKGFGAKNLKILEKNSYNGGHAYSHQLKEFFFDEGTHILHSKNKFFLKLLLKNKKYISKSSKVLNFKDGEWFKYPVQNNLLNFKNKIDYLTSFLVRNTKKIGNNYHDWCLSAYGDEITNKFYKVYTKKYWNKDLKILDTSWLPGRVFKAEDKQVIKNTFFSNKETVSTFNEFKYPKKFGFYGFFKQEFKKYENIVENEIVIKKINQKKRTIYYNKKEYAYENIYSSIPLHELKKIIKFPKDIIRSIDALEFTSLYTINIIIKNKSFKFSHDWNYLYDKKSKISRVSILNNINKKKKLKKIALQAEIFVLGGKKKKVNFTRELKHLAKVFDFKIHDITDYKIKFVKYSYVISKNTNFKNVKKIKDYLNEYKIYPFGLYGDWQYYWSDQAYLKGMKLGSQLVKKKS